MEKKKNAKAILSGCDSVSASYVEEELATLLTEKYGSEMVRDVATIMARIRADYGYTSAQDHASEDVPASSDTASPGTTSQAVEASLCFSSSLNEAYLQSDLSISSTMHPMVDTPQASVSGISAGLQVTDYITAFQTPGCHPESDAHLFM